MTHTETLLENLRSAGVKISAADEKLTVDAPKGALTEEVKELLRRHKARILSALGIKPTPEIRREQQNVNLVEILNRMVEQGVSFDTAVDDFQVVNADKLSQSDREFLRLNEGAVLCTLQQSLLMKHMFSHSTELFEDFVFEVRERESIVTECAETNYDSYFAAVTDVTRLWFERLVNE